MNKLFANEREKNKKKNETNFFISNYFVRLFKFLVVY